MPRPLYAARAALRRPPYAGTDRHPRLALPAIALGFVALLSLDTGCATYSDRMSSAATSASAGDYQSGIGEVDKFLGVSGSEEIPDDFDSEQALALLERGALKQAISEYESSSKDLQAADKQLEYIDLSGDAAGSIGKYLFSDSAAKYRASPTEKLALNAVNMMNYLALGDSRGARVEAKRFSVMQTYLREYDPELGHAAFGSYLAGFVHEQLDEYGTAMRYYDQALEDGSLDSLREPIRRLSSLTSYRGRHIADFMSQSQAGATRGAAAGKNAGDLLVVVGTGRVPHKIPERMPIGAAVGMAGAFISGNPEVLGYSATKVVVYPELTDSPNQVLEVSGKVDGRQVSLEKVTDIGLAIRREYDDLRPQIIGAAITRMITRAIAAEATRAAVTEGGGAGSGAGFLAALLVEGTMVALDKPDTRSWLMLSDRIYVYRERLAAGQHSVTVTLGPGALGEYTREIDIPKGGYQAIVIAAPR